MQEIKQSIAKINALINAGEFYVAPITDDTVKLSIQFYDRITGFTNKTPHISTEGDGEVTFEYWHKGKVLCFFVNPDSSIETLQCWGPHIWEEIKEAMNSTDEDLVGLWEWFNE